MSRSHVLCTKETCFQDKKETEIKTLRRGIIAQSCVFFAAIAFS